MADILQRPVMSFVLQWNDLESLQVRIRLGTNNLANFVLPSMTKEKVLEQGHLGSML
jgi:hypothetical protein